MRPLLDLRPLYDQGSPTFRDRKPLPLVEVDIDDRGLPPGTPITAWRFGECTVIRTYDGGPHGWHLSIAHPRRYPTWDEIAEARYRCLDPTITVAMFLPPEDRYINVHRNCFQLHQVAPDEVERIATLAFPRVATGQPVPVGQDRAGGGAP